jgi:hypothetical protein
MESASFSASSADDESIIIVGLLFVSVCVVNK